MHNESLKDEFMNCAESIDNRLLRIDAMRRKSEPSGITTLIVMPDSPVNIIFNKRACDVVGCISNVPSYHVLPVSP
jgi:hypothetical protein